MSKYNKNEIVKGMLRGEYYKSKRKTFVYLPDCSKIDQEKILAKFNSSFVKGKTCWNWTALLNSAGYPVADCSYYIIRGHRLSWSLHNDKPLPKDMVIRHKCDNPICVNPDHLLIGTHADNIADRIKRKRGSLYRLSIQDVLFIRENTHMTNIELSKMFNVTDGNISAIRQNRSWKKTETYL